MGMGIRVVNCGVDCAAQLKVRLRRARTKKLKCSPDHHARTCTPLFIFLNPNS